MQIPRLSKKSIFFDESDPSRGTRQSGDKNIDNFSRFYSFSSSRPATVVIYTSHQGLSPQIAVEIQPWILGLFEHENPRCSLVNYFLYMAFVTLGGGT